MKILMSHPTGNANVRAAAAGFLEAGILGEFHTTIATFPETVFDRLGAIGILSEFRRRRFDQLLKDVTKTFPWKELGRIAASKAGFDSLIKHETGVFSIDSVYKSIDRRVVKRLSRNVSRITTVFCYEDGALQTFLKAKQLGLSCFYDLPIGYWRASKSLLENEKEMWPDWSGTLTGFKDSKLKLENKDEELRLADKIFVASTFTAKTLKTFPGKLASVEIIPYGFPAVVEERKYSSPYKGVLKLLFVGSLSQRKGIANLFATVDAFKGNVELTIVGQKISSDCPALDIELAKHRWFPSLPNNEILLLMRQSDVLIFPSLFEGFGLVISEAMSQGTPVITTDRTAGPDLIENDFNGWIVQAGSTHALQQTIEKLLNQPKLIRNAGMAAQETARKRPWEMYGRELAKAVSKK